ncbi:hypothetical protein VBD025_15805 [Virgibacillus flavescens]|uniref:hypothetical protein n=1 Tax=Virgibacillus flavescens TaxID=1611422 RepID=UPI003D33357F
MKKYIPFAVVCVIIIGLVAFQSISAEEGKETVEPVKDKTTEVSSKEEPNKEEPKTAIDKETEKEETNEEVFISEYSSINDWVQNTDKLIHLDKEKWGTSQYEYEASLAYVTYEYAEYFQDDAKEPELKKQMKIVHDIAKEIGVSAITYKNTEKDKHSERYERFKKEFQQLKDML